MDARISHVLADIQNLKSARADCDYKNLATARGVTEFHSEPRYAAYFQAITTTF